MSLSKKQAFGALAGVVVVVGGLSVLFGDPEPTDGATAPGAQAVEQQETAAIPAVLTAGEQAFVTHLSDRDIVDASSDAAVQAALARGQEICATLSGEAQSAVEARLDEADATTEGVVYWSAAAQTLCPAEDGSANHAYATWANRPDPVVTAAPPPAAPAADPVVPAAPPPAAPAADPVRSVYYSRCAEAVAAGAAPLYRDDPGYRSGLDRDGDGVACE